MVYLDSFIRVGEKNLDNTSTPIVFCHLNFWVYFPFLCIYSSPLFSPSSSTSLAQSSILHLNSLFTYTRSNIGNNEFLSTCLSCHSHSVPTSPFSNSWLLLSSSFPHPWSFSSSLLLHPWPFSFLPSLLSCLTSDNSPPSSPYPSTHILGYSSLSPFFPSSTSTPPQPFRTPHGRTQYTFSFLKGTWCRRLREGDPILRNVSHNRPTTLRWPVSCHRLEEYTAFNPMT